MAGRRQWRLARDQGPVTGHSIAIVNLSKRLTRAYAYTMVDACARKMAEVVCPMWGVPYRPVNLYEEIADLPPLTTDPIFILDTPGRKGVYGEHFRALTPAGRIFLDPMLDEGGAAVLIDNDDPQRLTVASVLDHEIGELTIDPDMALYATDADGNEWDLEPYDMVQRRQVPQVAKIAGNEITVMLSDLARPEFFRVGSAAPWNLDASEPLPGPFTLGVGGYAVVNGDQVFSRNPDGTPAYPASWQLAARVGGRSARRMLDPTRARRAFT